MPMPHRTQMQLIKRRLVGKEGSERLRELRAILADLPDYRNGPYADIRKWVNAEMTATRSRAGVLARDSIAVRRQGAAQVALVGPPNVGKSTLLQALSDIQIRTGDFAFTTTRPVASVTRIEGVDVQLVEIPGLIEGATGDRGGGRALLGVLRGADAVVLCHDATRPVEELTAVRRELDLAGIALPCVLAATRADEADAADVERLARAVGDVEVVAVSVLDDGSLESLRRTVWRLTGLVRIGLRPDGGRVDSVVAVRPPVTVAEVADGIHHDLGRACAGARVWGPSARFAGQRVGRGHRLA
ncbi:MAG TPA: GTPase, partial [Acidimicrobiales bacterium]|nr:GTPase [Acidimicrobiales bacterium]